MTQQLPTKRAFLGMPGYGEMTAGAALGFFRASLGRVSVAGEEFALVVDRLHSGGSLLANNFNALWCGALNTHLAGHRIDYFAMLHSDIEPPEGWLDALIQELEARNLDMLGVVVPIKDLQGLTSIALENPAGDSWRPLCRLTMTEVMQLPETFTDSDVGYPLLLNTGCWVCRFDPSWAAKVHFTINDKIHFDEKRGGYVAEVEPEDWYFSRRCREQGLRIGATRKIKLNHAGHMRFHNTAAWGHKVFDEEYVERSVIETSASAGDEFDLPDIEGWLLPEEGEALAELARGKRVLEIGSYCGLSTVCMARTADHVTAVDYFDGRGTPNPQNTLDAFKANLDRYGVQDKVEVCHPDGEPPLPYYDLVFIDGAHDYESVRADIYKALDALKPGGLIAFHDYRRRPGEYDGRWDAGVTQAVNELIADGAELLSTHATLAVVRPLAAIPLEV
jgi:predicted O-methyltransferase YrrM